MQRLAFHQTQPYQQAQSNPYSQDQQNKSGNQGTPHNGGHAYKYKNNLSSISVSQQYKAR